MSIGKECVTLQTEQQKESTDLNKNKNIARSVNAVPVTLY